MRFILAALLVTGCARTAPPVTPVAAAAPTTTAAAATCGLDEPAPLEIKVEVKQPAKHLFDREACR
jgi:hypothetical protein